MLGPTSICWRLGESAFGRVLKGIREDELATQALGKNVFAYKVGVFGITAGLAGLAGALLSGWLQLATPTVFGFSFSLTIFAIVIFGGMANLTGSVLGRRRGHAARADPAPDDPHRSGEGQPRASSSSTASRSSC